MGCPGSPLSQETYLRPQPRKTDWRTSSSSMPCWNHWAASRLAVLRDEHKVISQPKYCMRASSVLPSHQNSTPSLLKASPKGEGVHPSQSGTLRQDFLIVSLRACLSSRKVISSAIRSAARASTFFRWSGFSFLILSSTFTAMIASLPSSGGPGAPRNGHRPCGSACGRIAFR